MGYFAASPVFQLPDVPDDRLYLVRLWEYVRAELWAVSAAEHVRVAGVSAAEAVERAGRTEGRGEVGVEELAMRWREQVIITVDPAIRLLPERDLSAVAAIRLPETLQ